MEFEIEARIISLGLSDIRQNIKEKNQGVYGLFREFQKKNESIIFVTDHNELKKIFMLITWIPRVYNDALEYHITRKFGELTSKPIQVIDQEDNEKEINIDISLETKWIAYGCESFTSFFGNISNEFYFVKAKEELVPKFVREELFPIISKLILQSFYESNEYLKKIVLKFIDATIKEFDNPECNYQTTQNIVWDLLFQLLSEIKK